MQHRGSRPIAAGLPLLLSFAAALASILAGPAPLARAASCASDAQPQRVTLVSEDKVALVATYYAPRESADKAPAALLVHGAGASGAELAQLALRLQKAGFAALTIDLRGHGESASEELSWKKLDAEVAARTWNAAARDVKAGVAFLLEQKGVRASSISLVGHGAGCTLVARHAMRDERVRSIVLLSPQIEQHGSTLLKELAEIGGLPTFVGGGKDEAAPARRVAETASAAGGAEGSVETVLAKIDGAGLLADNRFSADLTRWMKARALPGAAVKLPEVKPIR